jgi:hypothetical protein
MNIRRAFTFAWRMTLAYLRIALSTTLIFASMIGLAVLAMVAVTLIYQSLAGMGGIAETLRFIIQLVAFAAVVFSVFFSLGLIWNVIGVAVGMLLAPHELSVNDLRIRIPRRLELYNSFGLPLFVIILSLVINFHIVATLCLGMLMFLIGFVNAEVARDSWKSVVDWYELRGRHIQNIKKKKNVPTTEKPKIENTEEDDAEMYAIEDDDVNLRKSR